MKDVSVYPPVDAKGGNKGSTGALSLVFREFHLETGLITAPVQGLTHLERPFLTPIF